MLQVEVDFRWKWFKLGWCVKTQEITNQPRLKSFWPEIKLTCNIMCFSYPWRWKLHYFVLILHLLAVVSRCTFQSSVHLWESIGCGPQKYYDLVKICWNGNEVRTNNCFLTIVFLIDKEFFYFSSLYCVFF